MLAVANRGPDSDAKMLVTVATRLLGDIGYDEIEFDTGGKKSRRRYIRATPPSGERQVIWVKVATRWPLQGEGGPLSLEEAKGIA